MLGPHKRTNRPLTEDERWLLMCTMATVEGMLAASTKDGLMYDKMPREVTELNRSGKRLVVHIKYILATQPAQPAHVNGVDVCGKNT